MSGIESITSRILNDAEVERDNILALAEVEKNSIISKALNNSANLSKDIIAKAYIEARSKKDRIISAAKLKVRNEKLSQKQIVIDEIFECALNRLYALKNQDFCNFVKESILSLDIDGDENLILNQDYIKYIDFNFLDQLNRELSKKGLLGEIRLSKETRNIKGGFILEKNGIEINNSYDSLINSLRDEIELDIAKMLFS